MMGLLFEVVMCIAVVSLMAKIADFEDERPVLWGGIALALCIVSFVTIPLFLIRIAIAGVVTFVGFVVYRIVAKRT